MIYRNLNILLPILMIGATLFIKTYADVNVSVSMRVGEALGSVLIEGQSVPNSYVTILLNGTTTGNVLADANGNFTKLLTSLEPGIISLGLYYTSPTGEISSTVNQEVAVITDAQVTVYNFVLPPTISARYEKENRSVYVHGYAIKDSTVYVFTDKLSDSFKTKANENGKWDLSIDVTNKKLNVLQVYAKSVDALGRQSKQSNTVRVHIKNNYFTEIINKIPDEKTRTIVERFFNPLAVLFSEFDLDSNGVITRDEAYNVVKNWTKSWRVREGSCDLNNDGKCNIVDFSIMLFYIDRE